MLSSEPVSFHEKVILCVYLNGCVGVKRVRKEFVMGSLCYSHMNNNGNILLGFCLVSILLTHSSNTNIRS